MRAGQPRPYDTNTSSLFTFTYYLASGCPSPTVRMINIIQKILKMSEKWCVFENKGEHLFTLHKNVLNNHRIFSSKTPVLD